MADAKGGVLAKGTFILANTVDECSEDESAQVPRGWIPIVLFDVSKRYMSSAPRKLIRYANLTSKADCVHCRPPYSMHAITGRVPQACGRDSFDGRASYDPTGGVWSKLVKVADAHNSKWCPKWCPVGVERHEESQHFRRTG